MDKIFIRNLAIATTIGILPHECTSPQTLMINLNFDIDARAISQYDQIEKAIDYAAIRECLINFGETHRYHLIETFAEHCANHLLQEFPLTKLTLSIEKPHLFPDTESVGVIIERQR